MCTPFRSLFLILLLLAPFGTHQRGPLASDVNDTQSVDGGAAAAKAAEDKRNSKDRAAEFVANLMKVGKPAAVGLETDARDSENAGLDAAGAVTERAAASHGESDTVHHGARAQIKWRHHCDYYRAWHRVNKLWENVLGPHKLGLCSKNYGADGNCLYHAIAGILKDYGLTRKIVGITTTELPASVSLSLEDLTFDEEYYDVKGLRKMTAINYIGVDPHNDGAVQFWDKGRLLNNLELSSALEGSSGYQDVQWGPSGFLRELRSGKDYREIAKAVYAKLIDCRPWTWGGHEDLVALSTYLNFDLYLFWSDKASLTLVGAPHHIPGPRPSMLLYYYKERHFDGAGVVHGIDRNPMPNIVSMYTSTGFPAELYEMHTVLG